MRAFGWVLGGVAAFLVGGASLLALAPPRPVRVTLGDGEYVVASPEDPRLREGVGLRARALLRSELLLRADDEVWSARLDELGFSVDGLAFWAAAKEAVGAAQSSDAGFSAGRVLGWLQQRPLVAAVYVPLELDASVARDFLTAHARGFDKKPLDAELLIAEYRVEKSEMGRRLSIESSLLRLEKSAIERGALVELDVEQVRPQVTEEDLLPVDVTRVLSSYETSFRGKAGARAVNIRAAARFLDGAVLLPGEVLSFNSRVGRRVHARGFVDAPVIVNDEFEQDVGGGVCQVASTLHAAAVFGNLEIVQRRSHSRPSGYAPLGLDATVIDGEVDLKIRNPYDEPLLVHSWVNAPYKIRVEILGRDPDVEVEHAYSVTHREPFGRRVWYREGVAPETFEQKQKGSQGMDVTSVLRIRKSDGTVERHSYFSKYYPVPEVFWVGRRVATEALPPLPDGAAGLWVDGESVPLSKDRRPPSPEDVPRLDETDPARRSSG